MKNRCLFYLILLGICFIQPIMADNNSSSDQPKPSTTVVPVKSSPDVVIVPSPHDNKLIKQLFKKVSYKNFQRYPSLKLFKIKEPAQNDD